VVLCVIFKCGKYIWCRVEVYIARSTMIPEGGVKTV
jgi:hypothetical protein